MANAQWLASLQDYPNMDYSEEWIDGVVRSNPDVGATMSRPRFTRTRIKANLTIWLDSNLYQEFVEWYNFELAQGSMPFDWLKPITGQPVTFKFANAPAISYISAKMWQVTCKFEEV
jgi:hypothetical protein